MWYSQAIGGSAVGGVPLRASFFVTICCALLLVLAAQGVVSFIIYTVQRCSHSGHCYFDRTVF